MMMQGKTIVVYFSCGAASAIATMKTIEKYGKNNKILVVNNPVANEDDDNKRFLKDVEKWLGIKIESASNPMYPDNNCETVWRERRYMSGIKGAPCTLELKKNARYNWELHNHYDFLVMGFTLEEENRHDRFKMYERDNILPVLIDEKITKFDCYKILSDNGIDLPRMYKLGYPNANCPGCVKATSPTYWNHVRKVHPEVFKSRAEQSKEIGVRLVRYKGKRIFLDELPEDAKGKRMKNLNFECGIFCEMK